MNWAKYFAKKFKKSQNIWTQKIAVDQYGVDQNIVLTGNRGKNGKLEKSTDIIYV